MLHDLNFLNIGMPWPPPSETERINKYKENKLLFEGKHNLVYKDWVRLLRDDQKATLEIILNWHKRLSLLWADLLLGEPPKISAGKEGSTEQCLIDDVIERNNLINNIYEIVLDVSRYGTGIINTYKSTNRFSSFGVISSSPPWIWFPIVSRDNIKETLYHVLAWTYEEGSGENKNVFLNVQIHEKGIVTKRFLNLKDNKISYAVKEEETFPTGLNDFAIIPINNITTTDNIYGLDDYSDLDSILQEMETRIAQISRILDKHSDPNMYGDENALEEDAETGETTIKGGGKFFPVSEGGEKPGYVVWDAQLEANWKELDFLLQQLYILSETSAACFGDLKQGLAESGAALKRLMFAPLAKAQRIRMRVDPALKQALKNCSVFDGLSLEKKPISIYWKDGLPRDDVEEASTMAIRTGASGGAATISVRTAIKRMDNLSDAEVDEELQRIAEDDMQNNAFSTPPFSQNQNNE